MIKLLKSPFDMNRDKFFVKTNNEDIKKEFHRRKWSPCRSLRFLRQAVFSNRTELVEYFLPYCLVPRDKKSYEYAFEVFTDLFKTALTYKFMKIADHLTPYSDPEVVRHYL